MKYRLFTRTLFALLLLFTMIPFGCQQSSAPCSATNAPVAPPKMKMTTPIPAEITTPDSVDTRLGTLKFFDGYPDKTTVDNVYDNLDFQRAVEAFLNAMPGASLYAMRQGFRDVGSVDGTLGIFENLMDSKALFLTPNTETVYTGSWLDLSKGPVVVESPPSTLGGVDDFWFRYVTDLGNAGPDKGKGGKFLFLPPGYKGPVPSGYFVCKSPTFNNLFISRGFVVNGDTKPAVDNFKQHTRIYPLSEAAHPPLLKTVNISGKEINTIHASNAEFFEEVNAIVQEEPVESQNPELLGQLAAIGITKGQPFQPDERMKKILADAAAVGNATARAISFRGRHQLSYFYPGKAWFNPFAGGSYLFLADGARDLDGRTAFFYVATVVTPAMANKMVGVGPQYAGANLDSNGNYFDGSKNYRLTLPPNVPAKDFWSVVLYDPQTRSELQTDQQFPSLSSQKNVQKNPDGSYDVYFGPKPPAGRESNWVQTVPNKGWFMILRLYGPLEPWFNKTWRPGDITELK